MIHPSKINIYPIEKSYTIPSEWYYDDTLFNLEKSSIFSKSWHLVGPEKVIPNVGDSIVKKINNQPIIISRQKDESVKAFYNVCQHRGGPLLRKNTCLKAFQCKYHGWTYNLNGTLIKTREFEGVKDFEIEKHSLKSIDLRSWMGLIFINFKVGSNFPVEIFKEIENRIAPINFLNYIHHSNVSYSIKCNWKTYIDNYLEGYHIPFVHPKLNKVINYKLYKTELFKNHSLQSVPIEPDKNPYKRNKKSDIFAYYYTIFPNILLNIAPGRLQTNVIEPISEKLCKVHFDYYFEKVDTNAIKRDIDFSNEIQKEDIQICEEVQIGLESKGYDQGRISIQSEKGLHHFQSILKKGLKDG